MTGAMGLSAVVELVGRTGADMGREREVVTMYTASFRVPTFHILPAQCFCVLQLPEHTDAKHRATAAVPVR
jgi:hypothetical protein